jgi:hypothetical protein
MLATRDAHSLYEKFGFKPLAAPERIMEVHNPEVYSQSSAAVPGELRDAGPLRKPAN